MLKKHNTKITNPVELRRNTLKNKHLARTHTLAKIEHNFLRYIFVGLAINVAEHVFMHMLDVEIQDSKHCFSGFWRRYIPTLIATAFSAAIQMALFYLYPYYQILYQLEKKQINEKNIEFKNKKNTSWTRCYSLFAAVLCVIHALTQSRNYLHRKAQYCSMIGINNPPCAKAYLNANAFNKEVRLKMREIENTEPNAVLPLDAREYHNNFQAALEVLVALYTPCGHMGYARECHEQVKKFMERAIKIQGVAHNHPHYFIQKTLRFIEQTVMYCFADYYSSYDFDQVENRVFNDHRLYLFSIIYSFMMAVSLTIYFFFVIFLPKMEESIEERTFIFIKNLFRKIGDIEVSSLVPGYYNIHIAGDKSNLILVRDELCYLLEEKGYMTDILHEREIIMKTYLVFNVFKNLSFYQDSEFESKFKYSCEKRIKLEELHKSIVESCIKVLKKNILNVQMNSVFYRNRSSIGYKIFLCLPQGMKSELHALKIALQNVFCHIEALSMGLCIYVEEGSRYSFDEYLKKFTIEVEEIAHAFSKKVDSEVKKTILHRKKIEYLSSTNEIVIKKNTSSEMLLTHLTSSDNKKIYKIPQKDSLPLSGNLFIILNANQNLWCYCFFSKNLIEVLEAHAKECNDFIKNINNSRLQFVSLKGERGFSSCEEKSKSLKLSKYTTGKPVDVQYKDPCFKFRLWGARIKVEENLPLYEMHTVVKKKNDNGKDYLVMK